VEHDLHLYLRRATADEYLYGTTGWHLDAWPISSSTPEQTGVSSPRYGGEAQSNPRPVLDQINVVVHDMDAMLAFYRALGVEIPETPPPWGAHHRPRTAGPASTSISTARLAQQWNAGWPAGGTGVVIGFRWPPATRSTRCTPSSSPPATPASSRRTTHSGAPGTQCWPTPTAIRRPDEPRRPGSEDPAAGAAGALRDSDGPVLNPAPALPIP